VPLGVLVAVQIFSLSEPQSLVHVSEPNATVSDVRVESAFVGGSQYVYAMGSVKPNEGAGYIEVWPFLLIGGKLEPRSPIKLTAPEGAALAGSDIAANHDGNVSVIGYRTIAKRTEGPGWYVAYLDFDGAKFNLKWTWNSPPSEVGTPRQIKFSTAQNGILVYGFSANRSWGESYSTDDLRLQQYRKFSLERGSVVWSVRPFDRNGNGEFRAR
jgi:hypothetical protein